MKNTYKRIKSLAVSIMLVIAVSVLSVGSSVLAGNFANKLQASVLKESESRKVVRRLVSQLSEPTVESADCSFIAPEKVEHTGEFVSRSVKAWAGQGREFEVAFYLKNTGNVPWFGDFSRCANTGYMRLGTALERDRESLFDNPTDTRWITKNRVAMLERRVNPGEMATFIFRSKAPHSNDIFREYFQPVVEGVGWLDSTAYADIYVGDNNEENENKLKYLGKTGQTSSLNLNGEQVVHVDISEQKLTFVIGDTVVREFRVSTGTFRTPTPLGSYKILQKQDLRIGNKAPHYRMPKWQHFSGRGHGFHALPYLANDKGVFWKEALNHIGRPASHGCIRLLPEDAEELYQLTDVGTKVHVHA